MMTRLLALIVKELLAALKDRKARLVLIIPPIIQLLVFSFAATLDVQNVSIGVWNLDNGQRSIELLHRFSGSPTFTHITYLHSLDAVHKYIDDQNGSMVIHIDETFSRLIDAGRQARVQLILDGRRSNTAQIVAGYASQIVDLYNRQLAPLVGVPTQPTQLVQRYWYNPNLLYYWYNVPCLAGVITMLVAFTVTAMSVAREREMGTFDQLLVSPLQPVEIMVGKLIPGIIIALFEASIIIMAAIYIFKIPFMGHLSYLYFALTVFACSIVGVGLFISSLSSTQQQAILGSFVFISPSVSLAGFATPIENMPIYLQYATLVNPLRYMLVIAKGEFLKAMPFVDVLNNVWPMAVIATITLSVATHFFRKRLS